MPSRPKIRSTWKTTGDHAYLADRIVKLASAPDDATRISAQTICVESFLASLTTPKSEAHLVSSVLMKLVIDSDPALASKIRRFVDRHRPEKDERQLELGSNAPTEDDRTDPEEA